MGFDDAARHRHGADNPAIDPVEQTIEGCHIQHIILHIVGQGGSDHRAAMIAQQLEGFFVKKARGHKDFEGH